MAINPVYLKLPVCVSSEAISLRPPLASLKVFLLVRRLGFGGGAVLCRCTLINSLTRNKGMIKYGYAVVSFNQP